MYLWHRIFIVITPWISFYLRLSFAKCQGNCEPLSLRRCILPDLISRIQPFFNIMLCRIFFYFCLFCHKCTSLICIYYLFEAWPNKVAWYIIELQLFTFFRVFSENTFTIAKVMNSCMLLQNEKKNWFFTKYGSYSWFYFHFLI